MARVKHPIREAERYLEKAKEILAGKLDEDGEHYRKQKYVKKAGETALKGLYIALDAVLPVKTGRERPPLKAYLKAIGEIDPQMQRPLEWTHYTLDVRMAYAGIITHDSAERCLKQMAEILEWAEKNLPLMECEQ
jgi:HEPN domain-containing protein